MSRINFILNLFEHKKSILTLRLLLGFLLCTGSYVLIDDLFLFGSAVAQW